MMRILFPVAVSLKIFRTTLMVMKLYSRSITMETVLFVKNQRFGTTEEPYIQVANILDNCRQFIV